MDHLASPLVATISFPYTKEDRDLRLQAGHAVPIAHHALGVLPILASHYIGQRIELCCTLPTRLIFGLFGSDADLMMPSIPPRHRHPTPP